MSEGVADGNLCRAWSRDTLIDMNRLSLCPFVDPLYIETPNEAMERLERLEMLPIRWPIGSWSSSIEGCNHQH